MLQAQIPYARLKLITAQQLSIYFFFFFFFFTDDLRTYNKLKMFNNSSGTEANGKDNVLLTFKGIDTRPPVNPVPRIQLVFSWLEPSLCASQD